MSSDRTTVYDPHFGDMKSAWLVFNSHFNSFDGRLIERGGHITHNIDQIIIIGKHLERLYRNPLKKSKELNDEKKFSRMSIIPGIDLDKYRNWNIGLVGLGGNGASCLESIVMMGVGDGGNLVLVDHDSIEVSNLSRIPYTSDVHLGMPKVQVAKKYLREIQPGRKCTALKNRVWDAEAQEYLKGVDLLFINSDNDLCRYYASYFSSLYSIPLMDAGAGVISHQGELSSIGGQVRVQIPGVTPCLMCNMGLDLSRVEAALPWKKDELSVEVRRELANEGYFSEELQGPSPSVFYLNQMCASLTSVMTSQLLQNGIVHPGVTFELRPPYMMTAINVESEEGCPICHDSTLAYENPKLLTLEKLFNRETLSHPFPVGPNAEKELKQ